MAKHKAKQSQVKNRNSVNLKRLIEETAEVETALRQAVRSALLDHKRTGDPIVVVRDGRVCLVPAKDIRVPPLTAR